MGRPLLVSRAPAGAHVSCHPRRWSGRRGRLLRRRVHRETLASTRCILEQSLSMRTSDGGCERACLDAQAARKRTQTAVATAVVPTCAPNPGELQKPQLLVTIAAAQLDVDSSPKGSGRVYVRARQPDLPTLCLEPRVSRMPECVYGILDSRVHSSVS